MQARSPERGPGNNREQSSLAALVEKKKKIIKNPEIEYVSNFPKLTNAQLEALLIDQYEKSQQVSDALRTEQPGMKVILHSELPVRVMDISDIHFGSKKIDIKRLIALRDDILSSPSTYVRLTGDLLDGVKAEFFDTIQMQLNYNLQEQFMAFIKLFLEPLFKANKILCLVGGYTGHEEWLRKFAQLSPGYIMVSGTKVPVIENGGQVVEIIDKYQYVSVVAHNAGRGGSRINIVGAQRTLWRAQALDSEVNEVTAGHNHERKGTSQELVLKEIKSNDPSKQDYYEVTIRTLIATGAHKGDDPKRRDLFTMQGSPGLLAARPGGASERYVDSKGKIASYATPDYAQSADIHLAFHLMNELVRRNALSDEVQRLEKKSIDSGKTKLIFSQSGSTTRSAKGDPTPHFRNIHAELELPSFRLPMRVNFFNGLRLGSGSALTDLFEERLRGMADNPRELALFLREMWDSKLHKNKDRRGFIQMYEEAVSLVKKQTLAHLTSVSNCDDGWKKATGPKDPNFMPMAHMYRRTGIPWIDTKGSVNVYVPRFIDPRDKSEKNGLSDYEIYSFFVIDGEEHSRSLWDDPFRGLVQMEENWKNTYRTAHNVITGGMGVMSGAQFKWDQRSQQNQLFVATPWLASDQNAISKANRGEVFTSPAGVIIPMTARGIYPFITETQRVDLMNALTILEGFKQEGLDKWERRFRQGKSR